MPRPTTVSLPAPTRSPRMPGRAGRPVLVLLLAAAALMASTAVLGHLAGLVALALGTAVLLAAGVVGLRAQWLTVVSDEPTPPTGTAADRPLADATGELRDLRDRYVAAVNSALDEGDTSRARELADAYTDDALRILTR